jgi:polar amino acid transport system substrate-binding protein
MRAMIPLLVFLLGAAPAATDEITWLAMEFPPFYIAEGPDRGQGIADVVTRRLQTHLTGYQHRAEVAEPAAIMTRLKAGDRVCSAAYIRTPEREKVLAYSLPDLILPPNGITIRRAALARFGGGEPVSLARLLEDRQLRVAVAVGRSYGPALDTLLERHKASSHVYWRRGDDIYPGLFDMLARGSVDYVIGYPYEALYMARLRGLGQEVVNLPLLESREYTFAHVVCPRNAWGQRVVAAVDAALRVERPRPEYRQAIERWLDESLLEEFRRQYAARFAVAP